MEMRRYMKFVLNTISYRRIALFQSQYSRRNITEKHVLKKGNKTTKEKKNPLSSSFRSDVFLKRFLKQIFRFRPLLGRWAFSNKNQNSLYTA